MLFDFLKDMSFWKKVRHKIRRLIRTILHRRFTNPIRRLTAFAPNSAGRHSDIVELTFRNVNEIFPSILNFLVEVRGLQEIQTMTLEDFTNSFVEFEEVVNPSELGFIFEKHGSDKSTLGYHEIYSRLFRKEEDLSILEIGIGTRNRAIPSNMRGKTSPGGSLRALREYFSQSKVYGIDVDKDLMFREDRVATFWGDQMNLQSLEDLVPGLGQNLDLVIDDGLHMPTANINSMIFAFKVLKPGGWIAIEDIHHSSLEVWKAICSLLMPDLRVHLISMPKCLFLLVQKPF